MNIVTKATGDSLTAGEFNQIPDELENVITSAGLSPDDQTLNQVGKSIAQYVNDGNFYATSGSANAITLSNTQRLSPSTLSNGLKVRFIASYNNTGATTINVAGLGAKNLKFKNKDLNADTLIADKYYEATYNFALGYFELDLESVLDTVKIYDTVSDLKNDANAEAGTICITKGYYSVNDGGDGKYLIRAITGSDVDDGGHILSISGGTLVAELITINGIINIKQFGAYGDDTNDDTTVIQNAINCASTNNFQLYFQSGVYKITNQLTLYRNSMLTGIDVVVLDFSSMSLNDYYIHHLDTSLGENNHFDFSTHIKPSINNIQFYGMPKNTSYPVLPSSWNTGTLFYIETHDMNYTNVSILGFNNGVTFGSNAYNITFLNSVIRCCNTGVNFDLTGHTNSGERIGFVNTTICNNILGVYNKLGILHFSHCSLDYNKKHLYTMNKGSGIAGGRCTFSNCHIEDTISTTGTEEKFTLNDGLVYFIGCYFYSSHHQNYINIINEGSRLYIIGTLIHGYNNGDTGYDGRKYLINTSYNNVFCDSFSNIANYRQVPISQFFNLVSENYNEFISAGVDTGTIALVDGNIVITAPGIYNSPACISDYKIPVPQGACYALPYYEVKVENYKEEQSSAVLYPFAILQYDRSDQIINTSLIGGRAISDYSDWYRCYQNTSNAIQKGCAYIKIRIMGHKGSGVDGTGVRTLFRNIFMTFN